MADTFLVLRNNDTSVQLFFHDGQNIDPTGLGALPAAGLETLTVTRPSVKHNNRVFTFLDIVFVIQDGEIFKSTDEAATFASDHSFTGTGAQTWTLQAIAPVPVMVLGAVKLVGFYILDTANIGVMTYDVAGDSWTSVDTGIAATTPANGQTLPVVFNGLVYARVGASFVAHDPVSAGTVLLTDNLTDASFGSDQNLAWNGGLWAGPHQGTGSLFSGMAKLTGSTWEANTSGVDFGVAVGDVPSPTSKAGVFIDPNTGNLIVMWTSAAGNFFVFRVTAALAVTDLTGTVVGASLSTLGNFGTDTRFWPHITRSPGGTYKVKIYATRGSGPTDPIEKFEWVDDASTLLESGVVGGSGDMAFPYAIDGGDQYGFFSGEKRVLQTAQVINVSGITVTCEAFQSAGGTFSVRGHFDKVGASPIALALSPMTILNPLGTGGLSLGGSNPGAQVDGVPADRTAITFDWAQITDGFVTGDNFNFQLEAL